MAEDSKLTKPIGQGTPPPVQKAAEYECRLKPGHPTGIYRRGGFVFHPQDPVIFKGPVPPEIAADAWIVTVPRRF